MPLMLVIAVLICYGNVIHGELQFDDDVFINSSLADVSLPSLTFSTIKSILSGNRSFTQQTFAMNYRLSGLSVTSYHVTNIILHLAVVLLVFLFVQMLLQQANKGQDSNLKVFPFALFVAAIFALHPLQTESVSYIVQRAEVLASLFYLACLIALLGYSRCQGFVPALGFWLLSLLFFIAGWCSKEIIITAPFAYLLCMIYVGEKTSFKKTLIGFFPYLSGAVALALMKLFSLSKSVEAGFASFDQGTRTYFLTQLKVVAAYLRLFYLPIGQNIDHDPGIIKNMFDAEALIYSVLWIFVIAGAIHFLIKYKGVYQPQLRLVGFGLLWFVLILSPTSSFVPIRDVMAEHRTYLALLGLGIVSVAAIDLVFEKLRINTFGRFTTCVICLVFIMLGFATRQRNEVWRTKLALWQDVVMKSPNKSRPHNNLANSYFLLGNNVAAAEHYQKAILIDPNNLEPYYNLALALKNLGKFDEALQVHRKFVNLVKTKFPK